MRTPLGRPVVPHSFEFATAVRQGLFSHTYPCQRTATKRGARLFLVIARDSGSRKHVIITGGNTGKNLSLRGTSSHST